MQAASNNDPDLANVTAVPSTVTDLPAPEILTKDCPGGTGGGGASTSGIGGSLSITPPVLESASKEANARDDNSGGKGLPVFEVHPTPIMQAASNNNADLANMTAVPSTGGGGAATTSIGGSLGITPPESASKKVSARD